MPKFLRKLTNGIPKRLRRGGKFARSGCRPTCCGGTILCCEPLDKIGCQECLPGFPNPQGCCHCGSAFDLDFSISGAHGYDTTLDPFYPYASNITVNATGTLRIRCTNDCGGGQFPCQYLESWEFSSYAVNAYMVTNYGRRFDYSITQTNWTEEQERTIAQSLSSGPPHTCLPTEGNPSGFRNGWCGAGRVGAAHLFRAVIGGFAPFWARFVEENVVFAPGEGGSLGLNPYPGLGPSGAAAGPFNQAACFLSVNPPNCECPTSYTYDELPLAFHYMAYNANNILIPALGEGLTQPSWNYTSSRDDCFGGRYSAINRHVLYYINPGFTAAGPIYMSVDASTNITPVDECQPDPCGGAELLTEETERRLVEQFGV